MHILKFDCLGLGMLTVLKKSFLLIEEIYKKPFSFCNIPDNSYNDNSYNSPTSEEGSKGGNAVVIGVIVAACILVLGSVAYTGCLEKDSKKKRIQSRIISYLLKNRINFTIRTSDC